MLEQFSEQVRECHETRADASNDPALKAEFLNAEKRWLGLACSFGFSQSLKDFTKANSERLRTLDERLRQSSAPGLACEIVVTCPAF
jgi:hypothetical protein